MNRTTSLPDLPLPKTIRSRTIDNINGLRMHVLEAGFETTGRPCLLLLHGFPELAYSWRKVMPVLAEAGYHVIAPDQRGYGRTTGWDPDYDGDLASFRLPNLVRDALGLVHAFGYRSVDAVIGHDFGSSVAAWCALIRPDVFRAVAMMSAPFGGVPAAAVQHRGWSGQARDRRPRASRARRAAAAAQALPVVLLDARSQRRHAQGAAGRARLHARLLPPQERGLESQHALSAAIMVGGRARETADLLHHGSCREHGRDGGARDAVVRRDRRQQMAARHRACGLRRRISAQRIPGRPAMVSLRHLGRVRRGVADLVRPHHRRSLRPSSPASRTGAPISAPACSRRCRRRPARR